MPPRRLAHATVATLLPLSVLLTGCGTGGEDPLANITPGMNSGDFDNPSDAEPLAGLPARKGSEIGATRILNLFTNSFQVGSTVQVSLTSATANGASSGSGAADLTGTEPGLSMRLTVPQLDGEKVDLRLIDGTVYLQIPSRGSTFYRAELAALGGQAAFVGALLRQLDPRTYIGALKNGLRSATYEGREVLSGRRADHYRLVLSTRTILTEVQGLSGEALRLAAAQQPKTTQQDVWFNLDGTLARSSTGISGAKTVVSYRGWGSKVDVSAPKSSQPLTTGFGV